MFSLAKTFAILFGALPLLVMGQSNRPFYMSTTATQAFPGSSPVYQNFSPTFTPQNLSQDTDLVSVFRRVERANPDTIRRIFEYLSAALPRILSIAVEDVGEKVKNVRKT